MLIFQTLLRVLDSRHFPSLEEVGLRLMKLDMDPTMFAKLLHVAPKTLELSIVGMSGRRADLDQFTWNSCCLETLKITEGLWQTNPFGRTAATFQTMQGLTSLKEFCFTRCDHDHDENLDCMMEQNHSTQNVEATEELIGVLNNNPQLNKLSFDGFLPEKTLFCQYLTTNTSLQSLDLESLVDHSDSDGRYYLAALAEVLQYHNTTLLKIDYFEGSEGGRWGRQNIEYYLQLNKEGLREMQTFRKEEAVKILIRFCRESHFVQGRRIWPGRYPRRLDSWAAAQEQWKHKDICLLYGLLRKSPGGWAKAAIEAAYNTPSEQVPQAHRRAPWQPSKKNDTNDRAPKTNEDEHKHKKRRTK